MEQQQSRGEAMCNALILPVRALLGLDDPNPSKIPPLAEFLGGYLAGQGRASNMARPSAGASRLPSSGSDSPTPTNNPAQATAAPSAEFTPATRTSAPVVATNGPSQPQVSSGG